MSFNPDSSLLVRQDYIVPDDPDQKDLLIRQYFNSISRALNSRTIGTYFEELTLTGKQFVPLFQTGSSVSSQGRDVFRRVVDTGALLNTATSSTAHGITFTSSDSLVQCYGGATDPAAPAYLPLPFASPTLASNIQVDIDGTNVNITTGSDRTAFTRSFVVIEIIREI